MTKSIPNLEHLNELFAASEDPWHTRTGWYLQRKRDLLLASLPDARYGSTFEPGCGVGELTEILAGRTDELLALDARRESVSTTRLRTARLSNVTVVHGHLPEDWPRQQFDLIVLDEIGLSFEPAHWACLAASVRDSLKREATVVACHSKHRPDDSPEGSERLAAETLHGLLHSVLGLPRQAKIADRDFILDVWTSRTRSVAELEGLA